MIIHIWKHSLKIYFFNNLLGSNDILNKIHMTKKNNKISGETSRSLFPETVASKQIEETWTLISLLYLPLQMITTQEMIQFGLSNIALSYILYNALFNLNDIFTTVQMFC